MKTHNLIGGAWLAAHTGVELVRKRLNEVRHAERTQWLVDFFQMIKM